MRSILFLLLLAPLALAAQTPLPVAETLTPRLNPDAIATAYVGGKWWDGRSFVPRDTTWASGGVFAEAPPEAIGRVVDLGDRYVVPPYGDAHTHMLSDGFQGPRQAELFQREGVLYALVVTDRSSWAKQVMDRFDGPGTIDVAYSHGGWTSPRSHPVQVYEWQALRYVGRDLTDAMKREIQESRQAADDAYFEVESVHDIPAKWETFLSHEPDVVKVYLMDVAVERPLAVSSMTGLPEGRGLSPEVLREVIRHAHAAGLRVLAHVETGADVRLAIESGIDGFVHMPGYEYGAGRDDFYAIGEAAVEASGARGLVYVPTVVVGESYNQDRPVRALFGRDLLARQLRSLHRVGARVALGADRWGVTSRGEADYMERHGFFDRATLLDLWTRTTPQVVFPGRAIGRLASGYEASLLALDCDPLQKWACTQRLAHIEKQGLRLGGEVDLAGLPPERIGGLWRDHDAETVILGHTVWEGVELAVDIGNRQVRWAPASGLAAPGL